MKKLLIVTGLLLLFLNSYSQEKSLTDSLAKDFSVTDIYGHTHNLYSDYLDNGKYVFIDFFSVGCQSCAELSPVLDTVYRYFGCNYGNIIFLAIDGYSNNSGVFDFTIENKMTFPASSGNEGGGNTVFSQYAINYTPYKILIAPNDTIIADYPFQTSIKYYRDTLLKEGITPKLCSGNNFLFYALLSENDSITGTINENEQSIDVIMPEGTDLSQLTAWYIAESNSLVKINNTEQISGETVNDFSQGALIYDITSEDGTAEQWTVNVALTSVKNILQNKIDIYPNPVSSYFFIDFNTYPFTDAEATIYNAEGKTLKTFKITEDITQTTVNELPSGILFLKISTDKTSVFKKLIKK